MAAMDPALGGVGMGGETSAVPLPPDRRKARAYREASCPRMTKEIVIKGFGEHPDPLDPSRGPLTEQIEALMRALQPIISAEYPLVGRIELDLDARDMRYRVRVANEYDARRLIKRFNGFTLGDEDEKWAPLLRVVFTEEKWMALLDMLGEQSLKVSMAKPRLTAADKGDRRFARFGISVYLYFYAIKRLARLMVWMAVLALPAVFLNFWNNRSGGPPGCELASPLTCVAFVSAGNVPTINHYNDSEPFGEFLSHYDRHLLYSVLDILYTCLFLRGLWKLRTAEQTELATGDDDLTTASDYTVQVSKLPEGVKDPQLIRDFFEYRFGPVVEVSVAMRSSRLLAAYSALGKKTAKLHIRQAREIRKVKKSKRLIKLKDSVEALTEEIHELTTKADPDQMIVCAFVTFDKYEDCQKALNLYSGFITGWLCVDHRFRWKGTPAVPGSLEEVQEREEREEGSKGCGPHRCLSGAGLINWGKRLKVERAPEPANIIWENFGHSDASVKLRRLFSGLASLVLICGTVAGFVVADGYRGGAPAQCAIAVCDDRLQWPLTNGTTSLAEIGLGCRMNATAVEFRSSVTDAVGMPSCLGGYAFCAGLQDEVRTGLELSVCAEAYFEARRFSAAYWEYVPWAGLLLVNMLLRWVVKRLGAIERHTSKAEMALSVAKKLFVAQFVNTCLALWLARAASSSTDLASQASEPQLHPQLHGDSAPHDDELHSTDGVLGAQWHRETGTGLTVALLINGLLPRLGVYMRELGNACCRMRCCSCCAATQEQLNERFAGQHLDLSERYACLWNSVFSVLLYVRTHSHGSTSKLVLTCFLTRAVVPQSSGMPALLLVGALDLSLLYHCEKVALFKYYAKPAAYDEQLVRRPPASCRSRTARTHRPRLATGGLVLVAPELRRPAALAWGRGDVLRLRPVR